MLASAIFAGYVLVVAYFITRRRSLGPLPSAVHEDEDVQAALKNSAMLRRGSWEVFDKLSQKYGAIYSFYLGRKPYVVLNSAKLAWDLLEKRGENYSSRPRLIMAHEILSGGMRGLTAPYGDFWRKWRKCQHMGMSGRAALGYREYQTLEASIVLHELSSRPDDYQNILQRFAASVSLVISYGRRATSLEDNVVKSNVAAASGVQKATAPSQFLVESWPILLWLPRPLQFFRRAAEQTRVQDQALYLSLLREVRKSMDAGTAKQSMASRCLTSGGEGLSEVELAFTVSAPFGAGVDTTSSSIQWFVLAALIHPLETKKARDEIDKAVGRERLPTFNDEDSLSYVSAYIKEVQRCYPAVPMGAPHSTTRDDIFDGQCIPRGTTVWGNIYTMMKDAEMFSEPASFRPERFLPRTDGSIDPRLRDFTLPFGFGRRQCPGMHVASQSLYVLITRILWAFDIVQEPFAKMPDPSAYVNHGLVMEPASFRFALRPRDMYVARIIEEEAANAQERLKEWD